MRLKAILARAKAISDYYLHKTLGYGGDVEVIAGDELEDYAQIWRQHSEKLIKATELLIYTNEEGIFNPEEVAVPRKSGKLLMNFLQSSCMIRDNQKKMGRLRNKVKDESANAPEVDSF